MNLSFDVKCLPEWKDLVKNQVFTPCGRYGISLPGEYGNQEWKTNTLPVFDYFEKHIFHYQFEGKVRVQCDIIYCLTSTLMVSIKAAATTFKQQIWQLNHEEKTYRLVSTRNYKHNVRNDDLLIIHKNCRKDLSVNMDGKQYNIWISNGHTLNHHLLALVPTNPQSIAKMKLFYVNLKKFPNVASPSVAILYLHLLGKPDMVPSVANNQIYFRGMVREKHVFGVSLFIILEELVDVIDMNEVDIMLIADRQGGNCYGIGTSQHEYDTLKKSANFTDAYVYTSPFCYVMIKQDEILHGKCKGLITLTSACDVPFNIDFRSDDVLTAHPAGCFIHWKCAGSSVEARCSEVKLPLIKVPSLYQMCKRQILFGNDFESSKYSLYERILFS